MQLTYLLESLMEGLKERVAQKSKKHDASGVDIFGMLSKAQADFNSKTTPSKDEGGGGPPQFSSTPRAPDVTSQSVMDFFAKATTTTKPVNSSGKPKG